MIRLPTTSFAACPSLQRPDLEAQLELLEAEQARKLELQEVEMQPVDSQGTLTDWLAQKDLWQASENRLAQDPPHQGSCCADLPKSCLNTSKYD
jgi:hypothetical protein